MSITARSYYCGGSGGVRKLVDLAGAWTDVSLPTNGIPGAITSELLDIAADPNTGDKVYVVGTTSHVGCPATFFGIAVSSNAGVSWQIPTGNYQAVVDAAFCAHTWNKVSVVDSNVIYVCGVVNTNTNKGTIVKSIDGGLTFNQCSPLPTVVDGQDCSSIHFITPLVGVIGMNNYVLKTIDGGATWIVLNGGQPLSTNLPSPGTLLPVGPITGINIKQDQSSIIGVGLPFIVETIPTIPINNAGLAVDSWIQDPYPPYGFGILIGAHLSYLNPALGNDNIISVSGYSSLGIDSFLHGNGSWNATPAPGYDPSNMGFNRVAAHFYKLDVTASRQVGFYNKNNDLYSANYGFNPSFESYSDTSPFGINSVWTWYHNSVPTCYTLTNCLDQSTLNVTNDLSLLVGLVISIQEAPGCWTVTGISQNCVGSIAVTIISGPFSTCLLCAGVCYLLTDCDGVAPNILTSTDLSLALGEVVNIVGSNACYTVSSAPGCQGSIPVVLTGTFPNCVSCHPTCWILSECNTGDQIITSQDLTQYVNQVVKIHGCPDKCWTVSTVNDCTGSVPTISPILSVYTTCDLCYNILPPPAPELRPRRVKPGYYVSGQCSPEFVEKVSCTFAGQVYRQAISVRYGINSCCPEDVDKWDIKKQLLDFMALHDPSLCKNTICQCLKPCDVTALIEVPIVPVPLCPAPTNVVSIIVIPEIACPAPTNVQSSIVIWWGY